MVVVKSSNLILKKTVIVDFELGTNFGLLIGTSDLGLETSRISD